MISTPAPIAVDPRHVSAFGAAIICVLLWLQYAHRRKPFILLWAVAWMVISMAMFLLAREYGLPAIDRSIVGLSQLLLVCSGALFLWSADKYRDTRYVRPGRIRIVMPLAIAWFLLAPALFGTAAVLAPGYIGNALFLAGAAAMYGAVLLERRMIGAGLVAFVLLGFAITNLTTATSLPRMVEPSGQLAFQIFVVNAVLAVLGALGIHLLVFEDMTYELRVTNRRLEAAREELLQASITDPLTGCHNRRFLEQVMDRELKRHERFDLPLSLLFIDVNKFKAVNDTLGHETGDAVLRYVARFLKRHIREADYVFRWGGDEFLVMITCGGDEAQRKGKALKSAFDAAPEAVELPPGIGLSVGAIEVPKGTTDLTPLLSEVDARMYADKRT